MKPQTPGLGFECWIMEVNTILDAQTGLTSEDLPDWDYANAYQDGVTPEEAAELSLINSYYTL